MKKSSKFILGTYRFIIETENKDIRSDSKNIVFYLLLRTRRSAEDILRGSIKALEAQGLSVKSYGWELLQ